MCLIFFAIDSHPTYQLIVAANRDEHHARPTREARFWPEAPDLFAGKDLRGGGTWMGVTRSGRLAMLTNYREIREPNQAPSRGALVLDYLQGDTPAETYLDQVERHASEMNGFNLLVGDPDGLWYTSNRTSERRHLRQGIHGLSNGVLNSPWPKVTEGKAALSELLKQDDPGVPAFMDILLDRTSPPDEALPDTGVGLGLERMLGSRFILGDIYGTRACTLLTVDRSGHARFIERSFGPNGKPTGERATAFKLKQPDPPHS